MAPVDEEEREQRKHGHGTGIDVDEFPEHIGDDEADDEEGVDEHDVPGLDEGGRVLKEVVDIDNARQKEQTYDEGDELVRVLCEIGLPIPEVTDEDHQENDEQQHKVAPHKDKGAADEVPAVAPLLYLFGGDFFFHGLSFFRLLSSLRLFSSRS